MTRRATFCWCRCVIVLLASFALVSCGSDTVISESEESCIADSIRSLELTPSVPKCGAKDWLCRAKCRVGNAEACLGVAYALEKNPLNETEATRFHKRACLLGEAIACTNHAASIWANDHTEKQLSCARITFDKACAIGEPFACGMVGRLMLENTTPPQFAEARKYLESACDKASGFPCRVLAMHLESGKLGSYEPDLIQTLLAQACSAGDPDACGEPETASETFH